MVDLRNTQDFYSPIPYRWSKIDFIILLLVRSSVHELLLVLRHIMMKRYS